MYYDFSALLLLVTGGVGLIVVADKVLIRSNKSGRFCAMVEYLQSIFPVLLVVLLLRTLWFEPFRIPSGSMKPSLLEGDFIVVNKYIYGIRLPLFGTKIVKMADPKRGEVMVFRFPKDVKFNYIKRIVGIPGDVIRYENKTLYVNDKPMPQNFIENTVDNDLSGAHHGVEQFKENLDGVDHMIWRTTFSDRPQRFEVPAGHYFMMGDNRDFSGDSRVWGFVSEELIVGRAAYVWFSWDMLHKDIRWNRIGMSI